MKHLIQACLAILLGTMVSAAPAPALIPFQGRLTNQEGEPYTNGQFTLIFTLYDEPVGGTVLWTETHQKVGVINGMVNVFLGSINPALANLDFSQIRYLGITVDADNNPNNPDPEMVPRQMILAAIWAKGADNARKLQGADWSSILANGATDPITGKVDGRRISGNSISAESLADRSVTSRAIEVGAISGTNLAPASIGGSHIQNESIPFEKLAPRQLGQTVGIGGIAVSAGSGHQTNTAASIGGGYALIRDLSVKIETSGRRPVFLGLVADESGYGSISSVVDSAVPPHQLAETIVTYFRDGQRLVNVGAGVGLPRELGRLERLASPLWSFSTMDLNVEPGVHEYSVGVSTGGGNFSVLTDSVRLVAFEL